MAFGDRLKHAWNAFMNRAPTAYRDIGAGYYRRPDRVRLTGGNERSIVTSVYNRIALDIAAVDIMHVRLDENGRYVETMDSGLNYCLTTEANIDQSKRAFIQDVAISLFDEGCVAIVPVETSFDPDVSDNELSCAATFNWFKNAVNVSRFSNVVG